MVARIQGGTTDIDRMTESELDALYAAQMVECWHKTEAECVDQGMFCTGPIQGQGTVPRWPETRMSCSNPYCESGVCNFPANHLYEDDNGKSCWVCDGLGYRPHLPLDLLMGMLLAEGWEVSHEFSRRDNEVISVLSRWGEDGLGLYYPLPPDPEPKDFAVAVRVAVKRAGILVLGLVNNK